MHIPLASYFMAVAKSGKGSNQARKRLRKMSGEVASGLGSVVETSLSDQSQSQVVDISQYTCAITNGETSRVFSERDITTIMRAGLNTPMGAAYFQETHGVG